MSEARCKRNNIFRCLANIALTVAIAMIPEHPTHLFFFFLFFSTGCTPFCAAIFWLSYNLALVIEGALHWNDCNAREALPMWMVVRTDLPPQKQ